MKKYNPLVVLELMVWDKVKHYIIDGSGQT